MNHKAPDRLGSGFCIYLDTVFQGPVPVVSDGERYVIFSTELEAQREIVDHQMTSRLMLQTQRSGGCDP